ncbi:Protein kinase, ATP binding site-containing protein [Cynara cardunculus var. scolymus]|uniref:mitogen-activated protein kinase kinase kinase n=1 Tax=Cynara cardunculus var. scolymus TaxID=59895 RepID=A0A124SD00_CYNCS|nr:Protein kinase, ATP binding site-containing protein [Cynara cardunculus var. scolymus]
MSPWWSKSSSKEVKKKPNRGSIFGSIQRKLKSPSEGKQNSSRRRSEIASEKGSHSRAGSRSPSPSTPVARSHSFAERPHAHPLPLPGNFSGIRSADSGKRTSRKPGIAKGSSPLLLLPLPKPRHPQNAQGHADAEGDLATDSAFTDSSSDSDDPSDSRLLSPQASDYENGNKTSTNSPSSANYKIQNHIITQKKREKLKPANTFLNNQTVPVSPKRRPLSRHMAKLQIPQSGAFFSAPDSSMSSPSRSPMRVFGPEPTLTSGFWAGRPCAYADAGFLGSGHCSSPGSGHNSSHNSVGGDMSAQLFWQPSRCSPECSPIPSPRMTSPGPSSRIQSGSVTPSHPRFGGSNTDLSANWPDDAVNGKQQSHRLPLPPLTISNVGPYSPSYSTGTTPTVPRSPGRADFLVNHGSRWKKGRLLGRGTFGHVYLGFNSGEMCAMKEVTLFMDDAKSKESAQQLGQISGPSCPLSFKGSPYWMAPEVINNNSNGCNLAVDIWSLGCTVLEMATTKPPWSQYEGVAALFKVGNSKELPAIPDHLSDDGKDFILQCLQRTPSRRPSAAQLLDHPFVKNIVSSERLIPNPVPITNMVRSLGIGHTSEGVSVLPSRSPKSSSGFSPLLHPRCGQTMNGKLSPSPISSPRTISGSSTPLTGPVGTVPFYHHQVQVQVQKQPGPYSHELTSRSPNRSFGNIQEPKADMFRAMPQGSPFFQEIVPQSDNDFLGNQKETYGGGKSVLADRVFQQLLRDHHHVKQNPAIDLKPASPVVNRREWS